MFGGPFKKILFLVLFLNFLSLPSFSQTEVEKQREIIVVSLLGDYFVNRKLGPNTPKTWSYFPVPEWGINRLVQTTLANYLLNQKVDSVKIWDINDPKILTCVHQFEITEECEAAFFSAARDMGFENILLVLPKGTYQHAATQTESYAKAVGNRIPGGYGFLDSGGGRCTYSLFSIGFYNVKTQNSFSNSKDNGKLNQSFFGLPCYSKRFFDKKTEKRVRWEDDFEDYSSDEKAWMKSYIERGLKEDLLVILAELDLFEE